MTVLDICSIAIYTAGQKISFSLARVISLETNICDEQDCSMETSGTALTPEHSSPHCVAEWGVSRFNGQANGFENLNCCRGPQSLFVCPVHPPHPHSARIRRNRQFNSFIST